MIINYSPLKNWMKKKKKQNNSIKIKIIQKTIGQKWTHMCIY